MRVVRYQIVFVFFILLLKCNLSFSKPSNAVKCMALNLYFEASTESIDGRIAVGNVTLNRMKSIYYPKTVCGVVYQASQFSWTNDGRSDIPEKGKTWDTMLRLSRRLINHQYKDNTGTASHYYNPRKASPYWAKVYEFKKRIGLHDFYKMPNFLTGKNNKKVNEYHVGNSFNLTPTSFITGTLNNYLSNIDRSIDTRTSPSEDIRTSYYDLMASPTDLSAFTNLIERLPEESEVDVEFSDSSGI